VRPDASRKGKGAGHSARNDTRLVRAGFNIQPRNDTRLVRAGFNIQPRNDDDTKEPRATASRRFAQRQRHGTLRSE
jgi:hypothetical protein